MRSVTIMPHQTVMDIAIQEYGDIATAFKIARENNVSPTATLSPGSVLNLPDIVENREMQTYCKNNSVQPATAQGVESEIRLRIFTEQFTKEFM